jgi:hypothetical protein
MTIISTCTSFAGDFDVHGDAPVLYRAHWSMLCSQSFNWSHWTPQSVEYSLRIAPATASIQAIDSIQMHLTCWQFRWPWQCANTVPSALAYALCSDLQFKSLNATIGQVFAPYCPGDRQGPIQTSKNTTKTNAPHSLAILMAMAMRRYGTVPSTSIDASCLALQSKSLNNAIGQVFALYCPGNSQGPIQASKITQSNDKTNTKSYIH